ncbi:MAG: IS21-like element helper ATPase IstB [Peptococcaceae bacterium]|nr:IS21-like element helper ATPase IstB [Peptococcaceae bacterium]
MLNQATVDRLRQLRLTGMADAFQAQMENPFQYQELSFEERFGLLVDQEWSWREDRRVRRQLKEAKLRLTACMENIDFRVSRGLDRGQVMSLAGCDWVRKHRHVLITGATGTGKTFLGCALANAACRQGFSSRYWRLSRLLAEMAAARVDGTYNRLLGQLSRVDVLVLDDWGLAALTHPQGLDVMEVIEERNERRSNVVVSQLPLEHWHAALPDPTVADAILDRLIHNAYKFALHAVGDSMRKLYASFNQDDPGEG